MDDMFLQYTENLLKKAENIHNFDKVHLVLGNEACDLDSTISSLSLAYLLYAYKYSKTVQVFPILNVATEEFPLRSENVYVLNKIGVDVKKLVYRDTIEWDKLPESKTTFKTTLVDHHVLSPNDLFLHDSVVEICDHRPLDHSASWSEDTILNIEPVGSCSTLIAKYYQRFTDEVPIKIAQILYETIVFDTVALREDVGKTKPLDLVMIEYLKKSIPANDLTSTESLFQQLWNAHNDVSSLTAYEIMLKDLKVVGSIFIPGLPMLTSAFLKLSDFEESIEMFYRNKKAKIVLLMGLQYEGEVKKDMALYSLPSYERILKDLIGKLKESELRLEEERVENRNVIYFKLLNGKLGRKQVVPIVRLVQQ